MRRVASVKMGSMGSFVLLGVNDRNADKAAIQPQRLIRQDRAQSGHTQPPQNVLLDKGQTVRHSFRIGSLGFCYDG